MELMPHQVAALAQLGNGKVLHGGVGSGKSFTAVTYYMKNELPKDVYVITTAKKRDSLDWEREFAVAGIGTESSATLGGTLTIDSWNNIGRYVNVRGAFFIFDEQRVVGTGTWVKRFLAIARKNRWILLSATPGDTWLDYAPIFVANNYYKTIGQFKEEHVRYVPFISFPKVQGYLGVRKLQKLRNDVLVEMPFTKHTIRHMNYMLVGYDAEKWEMAVKKRWHPFEDRPITDVGELFRVMRKIANSDESRLAEVRRLMTVHDKLIIFYNFNYELEALRTLTDETNVGEYNGHRKTPIPDTDKWVYLVQYTSGAEGWNCVATNAMVMYSLTYSWKTFEQALGRIDRLDTKFVDLYYYILASASPIDGAIRRSLGEKKNFNEQKAAKSVGNWV